MVGVDLVGEWMSVLEAARVSVLHNALRRSI